MLAGRLGESWRCSASSKRPRGPCLTRPAPVGASRWRSSLTAEREAESARPTAEETRGSVAEYRIGRIDSLRSFTFGDAHPSTRTARAESPRRIGSHGRGPWAAAARFRAEARPTPQRACRLRKAERRRRRSASTEVDLTESCVSSRALIVLSRARAQIVPYARVRGAAARGPAPRAPRPLAPVAGDAVSWAGGGDRSARPTAEESSSGAVEYSLGAGFASLSHLALRTRCCAPGARR